MDISNSQHIYANNKPPIKAILITGLSIFIAMNTYATNVSLEIKI